MGDENERTTGQGPLPSGPSERETVGDLAVDAEEACLLLGAFRIARFSALISPAALMEELSIDRERAERLLARLEEQGIVGPVVFPRSGARESRVNMLQDPSPGGTGTVATVGGADRRGIGLPLLGAIGGAVLASVLGVLGVLLQAGERLVVAVVALPNQSAMMVIGALIAIAASGGFGLLVERSLTAQSGPTPAWMLTLRQAAWLMFALLTVSAAFYRMFVASGA